MCCPGPSLRYAGDIRGAGRTIYALNTAYPKIKPDVWIGLDRAACFDDALWCEAFPKICRKIDGDTTKKRYHPNVMFVDLENKDPAKMFICREDSSRFVWNGNSLIFALHYMIWKGHKKIHFVGCDMGGYRDYCDDRILTSEQRASNRKLYQEQVETLRRLTPLAKRNGIDFVSCTPDSPLNRFLPFVPLDEAIRVINNALAPSPAVLHSDDAENIAKP